MTDPLVFYRQQINERKVFLLRYLASKLGPVRLGQRHEIRKAAA